jgi:hypothetical protein
MNDFGAIVGTATYTPTGTTDPIAAGSHGVMLEHAPDNINNSLDGLTRFNLDGSSSIATTIMHNNNLFQWMGRNWIGSLLCLVLGGALFGSGYWLGQASQERKVHSVDARQMPPQPYATGSGQAPAFIPPPNVTIPPNSSPELKEFLQNRAMLSNKLAEWRAQNPNGPQDPKLMAQFQQDNAALLQRQKQLAQVIAQQPIPEPPPLQIPPNASPALKAFLTTRDQLMRDQIKVINQHRTDNPESRQAALQHWRQQNAALFNQLSQEAQALSKAKQA